MFSKEIGNVVSVKDNVVIIKYFNKIELKSVIEIASKYDIVSITNDDKALEDYYFNFTGGNSND